MQTSTLFKWLLVGIYADIEPYLLDAWHSENQHSLLEQFFERIETLRLIASE